MESHPDGRTDERTNGTDENYITLRHTSDSGEIIILIQYSYRNDLLIIVNIIH